MDRRKVLILGLDGLDFEIFRKYSSLSDLKIFSMHSSIPVTGPAWTTLYTGDSGVTHGVLEGWGRRADCRHYTTRKLLGYLNIFDPPRVFKTYETTSSSYMWDVLSQAGFKVKLFNLPITYPPRFVNGIHIAGFPLKRNSMYSYPPDIMNDLPRNYFQLCDIIQWHSQPLRDGMYKWRRRIKEEGFDKAILRLEQDIDGMLGLYNGFKDEFDFQMLQFSFVDRLGHVFGINQENEKQIYTLVNRVLEKLTNNTNYTDFFIISDHGFNGNSHTDKGVLAFESDSLTLPYKSIEITCKDFAPTVLKLFEIEHKCDGRALQDLAKGSSDELSRAGGIKELEEKEKATILRRLEELGYF